MKILIVDCTAGHNPKEIFERPTGGCLTSLTKVSEYLAAKGHTVYVSSTYETKETINGVKYVAADEVIPELDVIVFNRNVLPKMMIEYWKNKGTKIVWWLHDIVDYRYLTDDAFTLVDLIVAQSEYCKETYKSFYGISDDKFVVISNGIEPSLFNPGDYSKRNPNLYITASALIKGYVPLDVCFLNLRRVNPDVDFRIYSSQKLHGHKNTEAQEKWLDQMNIAGAHVYSPMSPKSLAVVMKKAWALLMPNSYPEMCSNLLLQARACGLPVVSSSIGANPEFLKHEETGLLTKWNPHDIHCWTKEFSEQAIRLYVERDLHKKLSEQTIKDVPTWDLIGERWDDTLVKVVKV